MGSLVLDDDWVTTGIHLYAVLVLLLIVALVLVHRWRLQELARRLGLLTHQIEGQGGTKVKPQLDQLNALLFSLGQTVERKADLNILPILEFVRREESQKNVGSNRTLVNVTETMIELFPMLGILGTVYAVSSVTAEDLASQQLLVLFGVATKSTLFALGYVIIFRIGYSLFAQSYVLNTIDYAKRYEEFLATLERRAQTLEIAGVGGANIWTPEAEGEDR